MQAHMPVTREDGTVMLAHMPESVEEGTVMLLLLQLKPR